MTTRRRMDHIYDKTDIFFEQDSWTQDQNTPQKNMKKDLAVGTTINGMTSLYTFQDWNAYDKTTYNTKHLNDPYIKSFPE